LSKNNSGRAYTEERSTVTLTSIIFCKSESHFCSMLEETGQSTTYRKYVVKGTIKMTIKILLSKNNIGIQNKG